MTFLPTNLFRKDYFGLSISQTAIRAISLSGNGQVKFTTQVPLSPAIFDHGVIDQKGLVKAVQKLLSTVSFSSPYAAVSLPEYHSFSRTYTLPKMDLTDVTEALKWQIEKIFPLPKDQIYFDWKLISQTKDKLEIVIVAVKKDVLDQLVSTFETAGIKPISFEPSASAITRIVSLDYTTPAILIEINPYGSTSSLLVNGLSTLTLTNQYQTSNNNSTTQSSLQATSQSVQSLINHYQTKHPQATKLRYLLSGESASPELANWLSKFLNQSVELLHIPSVEPSFHQAYAAAKTNIASPSSGLSINLLPDRLQAAFDAERQHNLIKSKIQGSIIFNIISLVLLGLTLSFLTLQLVRQQQLLKQTESQSAQFTYDSNLVSSLNKASRTITKLFPQKAAPISILQTIYQTKPTTIKLNSIKYDRSRQSASILGIAPDRATLFLYQENLLNTNLFSLVDIPLPSLENPYNIEFALSLKLKPSKP